MYRLLEFVEKHFNNIMKLFTFGPNWTTRSTSQNVLIVFFLYAHTCFILFEGNADLIFFPLIRSNCSVLRFYL